MITLGDAIPMLAKYCGAGKYPIDPTVVDDINQAIEVMMNKPKNWTHLTMNLILCAPNGQLTLPREVAKVIKCRVNGAFADVQSRWYEYLSNGPGLLEDQSFDRYSPLIDRGFVCTQYDIPEGLPMFLSVVSDRDEAADAKLLIRGHDETGREVQTGNAWGEYIPIVGGTASKMWITGHLFADITCIEKPVTKGYVFISAILPETGVRYFLGSIHPDETRPTYRRYFLRETPKHQRVDAVGNIILPKPYRVDALCRMGYTPASHVSDLLLIQNIGALKYMLKALRLEDADQIDEAMKYEATAERRMSEMTAALENDEDMVDINPNQTLSAGIHGV